MCLLCSVWPVAVCGSFTVISGKMTLVFHVFPFPFVCTGVCVCVCAPICVFGTQMYLYTNCFDFIKLTSFHGNTSWPRRLLLGCHITRCRRAVPIICQSAYLLWYHGTYTHYIAVFLWELIESGLSGLNTGGSFMLGSACFSSSNSFTVYVRT